LAFNMARFNMTVCELHALAGDERLAALRDLMRRGQATIWARIDVLRSSADVGQSAKTAEVQACRDAFAPIDAAWGALPEEVRERLPEVRKRIVGAGSEAIVRPADNPEVQDN